MQDSSHPIQFRPHHFLCTLGFEGKGYSQEFVRNFQALADRLRRDPAGDSVVLEVVGRTDSICAPCPNRQGSLCSTQQKIQSLDDAHAQVLGLKPGDRLTWGEAKARIAARMTDERFDSACAPCGWKALGICKLALDRLREESPQPAAKPTSSTSPSTGSRAIALTVAAMLASAAAFAALSTGMPKEARAGKRRTYAAKEHVSKPSRGPASSPTSPRPSPSKSATKSKTSNKVDSPAPVTETFLLNQPIDQIREKLYKTAKNKKARDVRKAISALRAKRYAETRQLAQPLQRDELFKDYGYALTAASYREEAAEKVAERKFDEALRLARRAIDLYPQVELNHPYSPMLKRIPEELANTEIVIGNAHHGKKNWKEALSAYERAFQRLSNPASLLGTLRVETLEHYAEACSKKSSLLCDSWIGRFVAMHPRDSEEIRSLAKFVPDAADRAKPTTYFSRRMQAYKATDLDQAAFESAMELYSTGKYKQAIEQFRRFMDEFPKSAFQYRARYWLGQALSQQQEHEQAQKVYESLVREAPLTYYGLLASIASGKSVDASIDATLPNASEIDAFLQPQEVIRLKRIQNFIAEGVSGLAQQDLREFRSRDQLSSPFLMYLATLNFESGNYLTSFNIIQDLINRDYEGVASTYGLRMIFPVVHLELIQKYAKEERLDPILVLSLMKQESAFDSGILSSAGATGLMQLMPATAVDTDPTVKRADLVDPETNIRVGTKYLKKVLTRFNGNIAFALAGYNAGPNAVARWVREGKGNKGLLEFIEAIPYKETREYVSSIIRNYFWYSRKFTGEGPRTLSYFWNMYGPPELPSEIPTQPVTPDPVKPISSTR